MHTHENGDELFYVVKGNMEMCFKDRKVKVSEGEVILVPKGVEHCPRTKPDEEVELLVIEPLGTTNTGNVQHEKNVTVIKWIGFISVVHEEKIFI